MKLSFDEKFFEGGERSGFFVSGEMKRAWAAELKVLSFIDDICARHSITYFTVFGTLLGSVRHKGFIPWDDDIDIMMLRPDYEEFMRHKAELPPSVRVLSIYDSDSYVTQHAAITNGNEAALSWNEERIRDYFGCPYIVDIDLYVYDYVPRDPAARKLQQMLYSMIYVLVYKCRDEDNMKNEGREVPPELSAEIEEGVLKLKGLLKQLYGDAVRLDESRPLMNELCRAADRIGSMYGYDDADSVEHWPVPVYHAERGSDYHGMDKAIFSDKVMLPFETVELPAPVDYEAALTFQFGKNYMTPVRGVGLAHDYPFFRKQKEYFTFLGKISENN